MIVGIELLASIHAWDVNAFYKVNRAQRIKSLQRLAVSLSKTADGWLYPAIPVLLFILELEPASEFLYVLLLAFGLERIVYLVAKKSFKRKRPANILPGFHSIVTASDEFSFPSGHTSAAFLVVTLLVCIVSPYLAMLYLWSAAVGCSRVILGVHFPSDILMGAMLGTGLAIFSMNYISL